MSAQTMYMAVNSSNLTLANDLRGPQRKHPQDILKESSRNNWLSKQARIHVSAVPVPHRGVPGAAVARGRPPPLYPTCNMGVAAFGWRW